MNKLNIDINSINFPCALYVKNKRIAKIKNSNGLIKLINILLLKGISKKVLAIKEYIDVEFEEINTSIIKTSI